MEDPPRSRAEMSRADVTRSTILAEMRSIAAAEKRLSALKRSYTVQRSPLRRGDVVTCEQQRFIITTAELTVVDDNTDRLTLWARPLRGRKLLRQMHLLRPPSDPVKLLRKANKASIAAIKSNIYDQGMV